MSKNKEVRFIFRGIDKTKEAFGRIKQNFQQLRTQLSKINLGFDKVGTAITAAFSASALKKIIDNGEQISRLSSKLDISTQSLSEFKYAAERCGVEFNSFTAGLTQMSMRISDAARNTGDAKVALQALGLSAKELNELAPNHQFELIAGTLSRVADESDKSRIAMQLFGSEGAALLPIIEQGASGIKSLRDEAKRLGISLSSEECAAMAKFNEELAKLQAVLTSLITSVLVPILPMLTAFFEAIRNGHPAITFIITAISTLLALRLAAWFAGVVVAVHAFSVALMANPLGLVAVAITTIIAALVTLIKWFKKGTESVEEYNQVLEETKKISVIAIPKQSMEDLSKHNELQSEAKRIFEQTRTPLEKYNAEMEKLNKLMKQGLIDQDTYNRAMDQNKEQLEKLGDDSEDVFSKISEHSKDTANNLIDNFSDSIFGVGGKVKDLGEIFGDFFKQLQADILKMTLKQGLFGSDGSGGLLGSLFGGSGTSGGAGLGSMFEGFFAKGGTARPGKAHIVGDGGEPELFIPNSIGNIIPFSKLEAAGASSSNIVVNMNIQTPDIASFNYSISQIAADMARQISRSRRNL